MRGTWEVVVPCQGPCVGRLKCAERTPHDPVLADGVRVLPDDMTDGQQGQWLPRPHTMSYGGMDVPQDGAFMPCPTSCVPCPNPHCQAHSPLG